MLFVAVLTDVGPALPALAAAKTKVCVFSGWDSADGDGFPFPEGCGCDYPNEFCFTVTEDIGGEQLPEESCYECTFT